MIYVPSDVFSILGLEILLLNSYKLYYFFFVNINPLSYRPSCFEIYLLSQWLNSNRILFSKNFVFVFRQSVHLNVSRM